MFTDTRGFFRYKKMFMLIAVILLCPASAGAAAFHAIIAGDTGDRNVGEGVTADVRNVWEFVNNVQRNAQWDERGTVKVLVTRLALEGRALEETLSHRNMLNVLHDIQSGPDDVILFYYSGHGSGDDSGGSRWPSLFFDDAYLHYKTLIETLQAKQPRLLIIITDACNNFTDWTPDLQFRWDTHMKRSSPNQENYNALFLNQQGYILATSSVVGEISSALSSRPGSLFTNDFLSRINKELQAERLPTWKNIRTTELRITDMDEVFVQHPQYEIRTRTRSDRSQFQASTPTPTPFPVRPTPQPTAAPQPVRPTPMSISGRRDPTSLARPLQPGQVDLQLNKPCGAFYSRREPVQIHFRTRENGYAIVYTIDAHNNVSLVFPNRHTPDNSVRASTNYTIPQFSSGSRQRVHGSLGFNEVRLLFSTRDFYHQSYPELQQELALLLDDFGRGRYRNYTEASCAFHIR